MAKSYIIKVSDLINRPDANVIKYWVDSYSLVPYHGSISVYRVLIGGTELLITDPDRINWDVVEIDETSILKRSDYPYFKMDKYLYKGISQALELRSAFIDNEYIGYEVPVHIKDSTAYNNPLDSTINAALRVEGGGYFGKNIKVKERMVVGDEISPSKFVDIDSTVEETSITDKALCTISNPGANAVVDANYNLFSKGAAYIDGGLSVSRNIVGLGNSYIAGNLNVKGVVSATRLIGTVALSERSKSLIAYDTDEYLIGINVSALESNVGCANYSYHDSPNRTTIGEFYYIASQFRGYGHYIGNIYVNTPDNKSICTAQLKNFILFPDTAGTLYSCSCEVVSGNTLRILIELFNSKATSAFIQNVKFRIRYTLAA